MTFDDLDFQEHPMIPEMLELMDKTPQLLDMLCELGLNPRNLGKQALTEVNGYMVSVVTGNFWGNHHDYSVMVRDVPTGNVRRIHEHLLPEQVTELLQALELELVKEPQAHEH